MGKRALVQVGAELAYFQQEFGASFERTYGWAWLLKLQEELEASAEVFDQISLQMHQLQLFWGPHELGKAPKKKNDFF